MDDMKNSAWENLSDNGYLCILEPLKDLVNKDQCILKMDEKQIKSILAKQGFKLEDEYTDEGTLYLKYQNAKKHRKGTSQL